MIFGDGGRESLGLSLSLTSASGQKLKPLPQLGRPIVPPKAASLGVSLLTVGAGTYASRAAARRSSSGGGSFKRILPPLHKFLECRSRASIWDCKMNFYKKRAKCPTPVSILNALSDFSLAPPRRISLLSFWQTCRSGRGRERRFLPPSLPPSLRGRTD